MKKVLKLYWPIVISLLFFCVYGILIGTIYYGDNLFQNDIIGLIMVIITALFVIAIYAEMIYFMIKACNNKEIKHKILWCVMLYFFHIFVFPYFNLKYLCNENKIAIKMFIYAIAVVIIVVLGFFIPGII